MGQRGHHPRGGRTVHDASEIREEIGDPEVAELGLTQGGDTVVEEPPVHRRVNARDAVIGSSSHVALAPSTPE